MKMEPSSVSSEKGQEPSEKQESNQIGCVHAVPSLAEWFWLLNDGLSAAIFDMNKLLGLGDICV